MVPLKIIDGLQVTVPASSIPSVPLSPRDIPPFMLVLCNRYVIVTQSFALNSVPAVAGLWCSGVASSPYDLG